jgi:hypothetical protein
MVSTGGDGERGMNATTGMLLDSRTKFARLGRGWQRTSR